MLFYDLDLGAIILWIIYGGVVIIFFLYSIMWIEILKLNIFFFDSRLLYYLSFYCYIYILIFDILIDTHVMFSYEISYNMTLYFDILNFDIYEELELLGDSFFFFSIFFFFISTLVLIITCYCIVVLLLNVKKIKYFFYYDFLKLLNKQLDYFKIITLKNQHLYNQEYESLYLKNSLSCIFRISVSFCRLQRNKHKIVKGINSRRI